jgi:hypothetical protein
MITVFLNGNYGEWAGGYACAEIAKVPGVMDVTPGATTWTMLRVRVEADYGLVCERIKPRSSATDGHGRTR